MCFIPSADTNKAYCTPFALRTYDLFKGSSHVWSISIWLFFFWISVSRIDIISLKLKHVGWIGHWSARTKPNSLSQQTKLWGGANSTTLSFAERDVNLTYSHHGWWLQRALKWKSPRPWWLNVWQRQKAGAKGKGKRGGAMVIGTLLGWRGRREKGLIARL